MGIDPVSLGVMVSSFAPATGAAISGMSWLGTASSIVSTIGTGLSTLSAFAGGQAEKSSYQYQAQVNANNVEMARRNAESAAAAGEQKVAVEQAKTRAQVGAMKASQAAAGVDVDTGSALDVRSSAASLGQLNAINIRSNAIKEAYGYQVQETSFEGQAAMDKASAKNAGMEGIIKAGTILGDDLDLWGSYKTSNTLTGG